MKIDPKEVRSLMECHSRPLVNENDPLKRLEDMARQLKPQGSVEVGTIQLGGWRREGTHHGNYDYQDEKRDLLSRGRLLYRGEENEAHGVCLVTEIWESCNPECLVFLVFRRTVEKGFIGLLDNYPGIDTIWEVLNIRLIPC